MDVEAIARRAAAVTAPQTPVSMGVNFLSPEELAQKVFEDSRESPEDREVYLRQAAQSRRREVAEDRYKAAVADRKRRQEARKAEQRLKVDKARAAKAKKKKMKKRGR